MNSDQLSGSLKVAILLQSMGPEISQQFMTALNPTETELIRKSMSQLETIPPNVVESVVNEFYSLMQNGQSAAKGGSGGTAPSSDQTEAESSDLQTLRSLEADQLFELIKAEHPQTIAIILIHVKSDVAGDVLMMLTDELKIDVSLRIANMDKVISGMVDEIDQVFAEILKNRKSSETYKTDGINRLAEILNQSDGVSGEMILDGIEEKYPDLAARIKEKMFVFEDLTLVDDRGMQKVLRKVETKELAIALKGASEDVRDKIYRNMSERAAEMLGEEIEAVGAVRMREVEEAQQTITRIIQDMENKGEIIISGRKGEEFIA